MKYSILLVILLVCGGAYLRIQQPHVWNTLLTALEVPETSPGLNAGSTEQAPVADASTSTVPATQATPSTVPTIVTPNSTYVNPDHVKQVDQPAQPPASNPTGFPSPLPPATNAPATTNAAPAPAATNGMNTPPQ